MTNNIFDLTDFVLGLVFHWVDCPEVLGLVCKRFHRVAHRKTTKGKYIHRTGLFSVLKNGYMNLFKMFEYKKDLSSLRDLPVHFSFMKHWVDTKADYGYDIYGYNFPCTVESLSWLRDRGYPWDAWTFGHATRTGDIKALEWLRENGCPWNESTFGNAGKHGHINVLKWLRENGCPWSSVTFTIAAEGGNLDILKWLKENGCPWNDVTFCSALVKGDIELLKWLKDGGCPWNNEAVFIEAITWKRDIKVLEWLKEIGCPWDEATFEHAVIKGDINTVKWLREKGCPWDGDAFSAAVSEGHLEVLVWLHENNCPWNGGEIYNHAHSGVEVPAVIEWLEKNGYM